MSSFETWSLVAMFMGSISSLIVAAIALFGDAIKRRLESPKLVFSIPKDFFEESYKKSIVSSSLDCVEICGILTNDDKHSAKQTKVICNGVYIKEANDDKFCRLLSTHQKQLEWLDVSKDKIKSELEILQGFEYYVKIAEISQVGIPGANILEHNEVDETTIRIAIQDPKNSSQRYLTLSKKRRSVLVSIKIISSNCRPIDKFIRIDWKGEKVSEYKEPGNLSVKLLSRKEGSKLINE